MEMKGQDNTHNDYDYDYAEEQQRNMNSRLS